MILNCNNKKIDLKTPKVMGILNLTPDSFYDGGKFTTAKEILLQTQKMLDQGANFIDIGAYSSKPNAKNISTLEEEKRILPVVKLLVKEFKDVLISVDTFRSSIAEKCINEGASIINDISGGSLDKDMFKTVAKYKVPYILMHMQGNPQNMQQKPDYQNVINDIKLFFKQKITKLNDLDVKNIMLDVGFGFGKTLNHNYKILKHLNEFNDFGLPLLVGMSRKSMLYNLLDSSAVKMGNATTITNTIALQNGAKILRVHDVKEAVECVQIYTKIDSLK